MPRPRLLQEPLRRGVPKMRVGVDTGGTFTDFVCLRKGRLHVYKRFSTPAHPEAAILEGLREAPDDPDEIIHGSTVATNALLERKGARVALLTTAGFEDVLVIGRQTRRDLYDIFVTRPEPLVPDSMRIGLRGRILHDGAVEQALDRRQLRSLVDLLRRRKAESVAVCLLFSFRNDSQEREIEAALKPLDIPVSLSSKVLPEYREYERTAATVINAYLAPRMTGYLGRLGRECEPAALRVMQSNGGAVSAAAAAEAPVRTIVSGPAGGVVGAYRIAAASGYPNVITFDMGGTSTDVSLCEGGIASTHEASVDGMPVGIPMIDIHTVGAGGGSIAGLDPGGALQVGPGSAGAVPGPICYGKDGTQLTVTDANVILGRLPPRFFLGGTAPLATGVLHDAVSRMEWTSAWKSAPALAQGVVDVVNNNMEQAIRLVSVERGHDPRDFALVCFGGAGGLHAADLARGLGIPRVVVPPFPGALSALGLLLADTRRDYSRSVLLPAGDDALRRIGPVLEELHRRGMEELKREGFAARGIRREDALDVRYQGQSYELTVPWTRSAIADFHRMHERRYGYGDSSRPVEVVNVRTTLIVPARRFRLPKPPRANIPTKPLETAPVWFGGRRLQTGLYDRTQLAAGQTIPGPAIVGEYSSTTLVPPDFSCAVDERSNLVLKLR